MKKVILSSAVVLLLAFGAGAQPKTDREKRRLSGSVRDESAKVTVTNGVAVEGPRTPTRGYVFDAEGNYAELTIYGEDGALKSFEESADDLPRGVGYNADGTLRRTFHFTIDERDARGNWTKRTAWDAEAGKTEPTRVYYRVIIYH